MRQLSVWLLLGLAATAPRGAAAAVEVVATVPDLAAIARELGGQHVKVTSLSLADHDPHTVDARPSLALALNRARLLLLVGRELEIGWLPTLLTGSRNPSILPGTPGHLDCAAYAPALEVPTGPIDRSMGDVHPSGNPHYLKDPRAAEPVARAIAQRLAQLDEAHSDQYRAGLERFLTRLRALRETWERRLAPHRGTKVIAYHKTWSYLNEWLGFTAVGFLEPKPGIPPNPGHVAQLLATARSQGVRLIIQERFYPTALSSLLASRTKAALVKLPGGTDFAAGESYVTHLEVMLTALEQGLTGAAR